MVSCARTRKLALRAIVVALVSTLLLSAPTHAENLTYKGPDGLRRVRTAPVDARFRNGSLPKEMEKAFWKRANRAIEHFADDAGVSTWGENEKGDYAKSMFAYLAGNREEALKALQARDAQADDAHKHTLGIDLYWCFTLKEQMRKYFFFGDALDPDYRKRMKKAADIWTEEPPLPRVDIIGALDLLHGKARETAVKDLQEITGQNIGNDVQAWRKWYAQWRKKPSDERTELKNIHPHPYYGKGEKKRGWGPDVFGTWVDVRSTDNLRAMRETSAYLMAEEARNEMTRRRYKARIAHFVRTLYHRGMSEWDSENYLPHVIAPYLNLYDFAEDPEVKLLAKAALDYMTAAGALKYWRSGFGGPTKRDYGGANRPFGAEASHMLDLYFDDSPLEDPSPHYDEIHAVTSSYRPPLAVQHLARKNFPRPVELINTKPHYGDWLPGSDTVPETWETLFFGKSYCLGTCISKTNQRPWKVAPFKMMTYNSDRGVDFFLPYTGEKPNTKKTGDQIGQFRNLVVWLRPADDKPFNFFAPKSGRVETGKAPWFFKLEKTWIAIYPIGLGDVEKQEPENEEYEKAVVYHAAPRNDKSDDYRGFAMEVGEASECSFSEFKKRVRSESKLDLSNLSQGIVKLEESDGGTLKLKHNPKNDLPLLWRDGQRLRWGRHRSLYAPVGAKGPINLDRQEGTLRVQGGGHTFTVTVTMESEAKCTAQ